MEVIIRIKYPDKEKLEFQYELEDAQIIQQRDIIPLYNDPKDWGKITEFVENPANKGWTISIGGKILSSKKL